ncbi:glutathione S-transferase family protein [Acaryochloris sp. IP29b_bin.137]|uniref:glutathione S-transferase family protein n=1 Tax=Acaryochloris sp. IP29b_bin.137 TaxID=2969217 RepID=UPI002603E7EE|nr:glutathione S-transferase family protein [Acaryochloris sp. IP29b_bin.137]
MGKSLPPKAIIGLGKFAWTTLWNLMMSNMAPRSKEGAYVRPDSQFRQTIAGPESAFPAENRRYRLYVGLGCPWAHRTLVVRALKGLQDVIDVVVVQPSATDGGWVFVSQHQGCNSLRDLYHLAQPSYEGRCTVPVLWDTQTQRIVNNESSEIILILNSAFNAVAQQPELDLYPESLRRQIDQWNEKIYHAVNNGVYRCGFAQTQAAYDQAVNELFQVLDELDQVLANHRYLCGDSLTLADVRLFPTLFRFDVAYYGLFKCNRRRIQDYPHLGAYLHDLYQLPGVADTCNLDAVKQSYYGTLFPLNPGGIIPAGPDITRLSAPHGRETMGQAPQSV